jgi:sulfite exporter TauE/SafE
MALTGAIILGNIFSSSAFMIMFGLGTIPAMLAVSFAGKLITINFRDKLKRFVPVLSLLIAVIFILRGLNIGIPYISPKLEKPVPAAENLICH